MNTLVKLLNRKLELFVCLNDISIIKALNQAFLWLTGATTHGKCWEKVARRVSSQFSETRSNFKFYNPSREHEVAG